MNPENIFDGNLMRILNYDRQCFVRYCQKNGHPPSGLPAMNHTGNPYEHLRAQPQQPLNRSNNPVVPQKEQERQNNGNAGIPQQQQQQDYGSEIMVQAPPFNLSHRTAFDWLVFDIQRYVTAKINPSRYSTAAAPAASSSVSTTAALIPALSKLASFTAAPASDSTPNRGPPALVQSSLVRESASSTATPAPPPNTPTQNRAAHAFIQSSSASKHQTTQSSSSVPNRIARRNSAPYYAVPVRGIILISRKKPAARK
uniref:Uncharacterized protein n=1 Tax=Panagrolaimus sp. PS1159 TaxID=55785 RepID=A0AC35G8V5_9BILA